MYGLSTVDRSGCEPVSRDFQSDAVRQQVEDDDDDYQQDGVRGGETGRCTPLVKLGQALWNKTEVIINMVFSITKHN